MRLPPPSPRLRAVSLATAVLVLGGCQQGVDEQEIQELRQRIAARQDADTAQTERLDELEATISELPGDGGPDPQTVERLDAAEQQLANVADALAVVEEDLAAAQDARTELSEELGTATSDLRASLSDLQGAVDQLRGRHEELETLYATLRDRLDRLDVRVSELES